MASVVWPCGRLGRPHGLSGEMYLEVLPHGLEYLERGERFSICNEAAGEPQPVVVRRVGGQDTRPLLRLEGVASREQAAVYAGWILLAAGGTLDEIAAWRVGDLIGLRACSGCRDLGVVSDVLQSPSADILQITRAGAPPALVPLANELVSVDLPSAVVRVREGLLEEEP